MRLQSRAGGTFEWMIGGYYADLNTNVQTRCGAFLLSFGALNPLGTTTAATPVAAGVKVRFRDDTHLSFGSATIRPVADRRINLGLRYTKVDEEAHRADSYGAARARTSTRSRRSIRSPQA